jgi:LacI family transcriptional regulator
MPNQRDIASAMGISQVAVSLALRDDHSISAPLRREVRRTAKRLGYRPNPYVSTLMTHIRSGRKPGPQGALALIVDVYREKEWHAHESYRVYYRGLLRRATELGFGVERFFLTDPEMAPGKIDRILHARGICGVILAPPYMGNRRLAMKWERYAVVGTGYAWEQQQFDRIAHDHDQNVVQAFQKMSALGYARIGMCIPSFYVHGRGARWLDGYVTCQHQLPAARRVPLFTGSVEEKSFEAFRKWIGHSRPDALLTVYGHETAWLKKLALKVSRDIGLACVIRPLGPAIAGILDRYDEIGAATVDLVASKIALNQYGVPPTPKLILIEGKWKDGKSLRRVGPSLAMKF